MAKDKHVQKEETKKVIIICAIIAIAIAVILTVVFKLSNKGEETKPADTSSTASVSTPSESTKSYTSEELSAIAQWWETVSITNEAE